MTIPPGASPKIAPQHSQNNNNRIPPPKNPIKPDLTRFYTKIHTYTASGEASNSNRCGSTLTGFPPAARARLLRRVRFRFCATLIVSRKNLTFLFQDQKSWKNHHKIAINYIYPMAKVRHRSEPSSPIGRFRPSMCIMHGPTATAQCPTGPPSARTPITTHLERFRPRSRPQVRSLVIIDHHLASFTYIYPHVSIFSAHSLP